MLWMHPADQRLVAPDIFRIRGDDRLEMHFKVVREARLTKFYLDPVAGSRDTIHLGLEKLECVSAFGFRAIKGEVGILEQQFDLIAVGRVKRDPQRSLDDDLMAVEVKRFADCREDL